MFNLSKKGKKNLIAGFILVIGIVISIVVFSSHKNDSGEGLEQEVVAKNVKVMKIDKNNQSSAKLQKTVILSSLNSADAVTEYAGRITQVNFEVGDWVGAGQILARFDQSNLANVAKISLNSLEQTYDLTKESLEKTKKYAEESIDIAEETTERAEIELDQAEDDGDDDEIDLAEKDLEIAEDQEDQAKAYAQNQIKAAQIQLEQVELQLEQARINYEKTFIKAPISGQIVSKDISLNDYLSSGKTIAQIVQPNKMEAKIYLNGSEVSKVKVGDQVEIEKDGNQLTAQIKSVSRIANSTNQRFEVIVGVSKELEKFINQSVKINLTLNIENGDRFFIPLESVNIGQTEREVFIAKDGIAVSQGVVTGDIIGNSIEIISGISEGDLLIVEGNKNIREGAVINVVN